MNELVSWVSRSEIHKHNSNLKKKGCQKVDTDYMNKFILVKLKLQNRTISGLGIW